jgi:hypothetical protein
MSDLVTWAKGILGTAGFIVVITIITLIVQTYRHWKKSRRLPNVWQERSPFAVVDLTRMR